MERKTMTTETLQSTESGWRQFTKNYKAAFAAFIVAAVLAAVGAVYVFVWFTGNAQTTGLVPSSLGLWSMSNLVWFIIHAIFWELVVIGIPAAVGAAIGWLWWKRIP